jgi:uncharacterized repeat protein (TIGR01451 family)
MDNGALISIAPLNAGGIAQSATVNLAPGQHSIRAVYGGNSNFAASRSAAMPYAITETGASVFTAGASYPVGTVPVSLAAGDFNGDGKVDLVASNVGQVTILLGNGDGTFQAAQTYPVAGTAGTIVVADFNGDGRPDLALADSKVYIMLGNGDGTFQAPAAVLADGPAMPPSVGDVNGDGRADLVVPHAGSESCIQTTCRWFDGSVSVLIGNGDGTFRTPVTYTVPGSPAAISIQDFNGDGKPDLALANTGALPVLPATGPHLGPGVTVLLGNGDGTFQAPSAFSDPGMPVWVAAADFNGDGKLDLAVADLNGVGILPGNGDGTFQPLQTYAPGVQTDFLAVIDFNGDGKPDLIADRGSSGFEVLLGRGDGTFPVVSSYWGAVLGIADFNGDGRVDIAGFSSSNLAVQFGAGSAGVGAATTISLQTSVNPSQFGAAVSLTASVSPLTATGVVEFLDGTTVLGSALLNSSGFAQINTTVLAAGTRSLHAIYAGVPGVWIGSESAVAAQTVNALPTVTIATERTFPAGAAPSALATADFNHDGKLDLAVVNDGDHTIGVLLGRGDGTFQAMVPYPVVVPAAVAVGDLNADGNIDLVVAGSYLSVLLGNGDATFRTPVTYNVPAFPTAIALGDFDGDGRMDVAMAFPGSNSVGVMPGNGDGSFQAVSVYAVGSSPRSIVAGDFDGDHKPDLAVGNYSGNSISVLRNKGGGTFATSVTYPVGPNPGSVAASDVNGDGRVDLVVGNNDATVSVLLANGDGSFRSGVTFTAGAGTSTVVADVDSDGKPDIVSASGVDEDISLVRGNGDGTFQTPVAYATGVFPNSLLVADFNGDARPDFAFVNGGDNTIGVMLGGPGNLAPAALSISTTHTGTLAPRQNGATYSIVVTNNGGGPTSGTVTVSDTLPTGVSLVWMSAMGWNCPWGTTTCTRGDALPPGGSYNAITVNVNIAGDAPSPLINTANVSGGGSAPAFGTDSAVIAAKAAVLNIATSHAGSFAQGQIGVQYTVTVGNAALAGPTSGTVTVTETLPSGLTLVSMAGTGWTCPTGNTTCTRSDSLSPGQSYPAITATVNVAVNATSPQVNNVAVSGGGSATATASDSTVITVLRAAAMSTPVPSSTFTGPSMTFNWTAGSAISDYWLNVGTQGAGSHDLYYQDEGTNLSQTVTGLPTNGSTIYVRLWSKNAITGDWLLYRDYTYTAFTAVTTVTASAIAGPTPGSTLTASSATFQWSAGTNISDYWLYVGSKGVNSADIVNRDEGTSLSQAVTGLPTDGSTVFVRLWSKNAITGDWLLYRDYTYTAFTAVTTVTAAAIAGPTPGSTLTGSSATFQWSTGTNISDYWLYVGSKGVNSADIVNRDEGTSLSQTVTGLPTDSSTVYVRLWSKNAITGDWLLYRDYTYTAFAAAAFTLTLMTSPVNGVTLASSSQTFQWTAGSGVSDYWLSIGTQGVGTHDIYYRDEGTNLSQAVTGLPSNGSVIYVRLWSQNAATGAWVNNDYTYLGGGSFQMAQMNSPAAGSILPATTVFQWVGGTGASQYWLSVSTVSVGGTDFYNADEGASLSRTLTRLPTSDSPIYIRLWSKNAASGQWYYVDYTYK